MKSTAQITLAARVGRTLGRLWQSCVRLDRRATNWLVTQGWAPCVAKVVLLITKLIVLGALVYATLWLALLITLAVVAAWTLRHSSYDEQVEWAIGDQSNHKRSVSYDPINYDDDPDPRFPG